MRFPWKQWALLTSWSLVLVIPNLLSVGTNIVGRTYLEGSERFWSGVSPYLPPEKGDVFLYSPFFAAIYAWLPFKLFSWALLNCTVFWAGISVWFRWLRSDPWYVSAAWIACSMELDGPLRYQQINPLLVGMILLACAAYRDGRHMSAGAWIGTVFNFKLLSAPFFLLAIPRNYRFAAGLLLTLAVLILLPAAFVGWEQNARFHLFQLQKIISEAPLRKILDIASVGESWGFEKMGLALKYGIAFSGVILLVLFRFTRELPLPWGPWISIAFTTVLLVNPRTESPTFVLMAPAYLFLMAESTKWERAVLFGAIWLTTLSYNTLWPSLLRTPMHLDFSTKTLGALVVWGLSVSILITRRKFAVRYAQNR